MSEHSKEDAVVHCEEAQDYTPAIAYLRQDVFPNNCLLAALENNQPPVPREVWIARYAAGAICGIMSVEQFPNWTVADLRTYPMAPEAIPALVGTLDRSQEYRFSVRVEYWEHLQAEVAAAYTTPGIVAMTVVRDDLQILDGPGLVRRLNLADRPLAERYPDPEHPHQPNLAMFVQQAESKPDQEMVFGSVLDEEIVSYIQLDRVVDNIWEVGMIDTRDEYRGRGLAKQLLSQVSDQLLRQGTAPLYQVGVDNVASVRTAEAVGYREVFRILGVDGHLAKTPTAGQ